MEVVLIAAAVVLVALAIRSVCKASKNRGENMWKG